MTTKAVVRTLRTAAAFSPTQLYFWGLRKLQARLPIRIAEPAVQWDPANVAGVKAAMVEWGPGDVDARRRRADSWLDGWVNRYGRRLPADPIAWADTEEPLVAYGLHYLDILVDLAWSYEMVEDRRYLESAINLCNSWTGLRVGHVGWDPYPTSVRAVNWVYAVCMLFEAISPEDRERLAASLGAQLDWLGRRIEYHVQANHLERNYRALAIGGTVLCGGAAKRFKRRGVVNLWKELRRQVLADGGHIERSPMYHVTFLFDYLEFLAVIRHTGAVAPRDATCLVRLLAGAAEKYLRFDGRLHLFGDSANDESPTWAELHAMVLRELGHGLTPAGGPWCLPETGYWGTMDAQGMRLIVDAGPFGAIYQPGHGHCDALSYELDLSHEPFVVDSGVCGYGGDPLRSYVRSTRAHNTVTVDNSDQSEVWGTFRVGRRAKIIEAKGFEKGGVYRFSGACRWADGHLVHYRSLELSKGMLRVKDRVAGGLGRRVISWLHCHPTIKGRRDPSTGDWILTNHVASVRVRAIGTTSVISVCGQKEPAQGWYCPRFGVRRPSLTLGFVSDPYRGATLGYELSVGAARRQRSSEVSTSG